MIQQYGPLVRNLPAMIKLYSQLGSADDDETNADEEHKEIGEETEVPKEGAAQDDEIEENEEPEDILVKKAAPLTSPAPEAKPKKDLAALFQNYMSSVLLTAKCHLRITIFDIYAYFSYNGS